MISLRWVKDGSHFKVTCQEWSDVTEQWEPKKTVTASSRAEAFSKLREYHASDYTEAVGDVPPVTYEVHWKSGTRSELFTAQLLEWNGNNYTQKLAAADVTTSDEAFEIFAKGGFPLARASYVNVGRYPN